MTANAIPVEARDEALRIIARFNQEVLADSGCCYVPRFKGKYLYLDREDFGNVGPVCRLEYSRRKRHWEFAIYTSRKRKMSAAGRARLAALMKARWAKIKKAGGRKLKAV